MNEPFIPLTAALPPRSKRTAFQASVIASGQAPEPPGEAQSTPADGTNPHSLHCEPRVVLQRDGERVSGIRIQCTCGQVIELACVYPEPSAPS